MNPLIEVQLTELVAEKALMSLPSPLTASDEYVSLRGDGREKVTVTAGLHRQVWVSGTNLFADVHIVNNSRKNIKKLELQLERIILCYRHVRGFCFFSTTGRWTDFDL